VDAVPSARATNLSPGSASFSQTAGTWISKNVKLRVLNSFNDRNVDSIGNADSVVKKRVGPKTMDVNCKPRMVSSDIP
jgi:hypothetical protein